MVLTNIDISKLLIGADLHYVTGNTIISDENPPLFDYRTFCKATLLSHIIPCLVLKYYIIITRQKYIIQVYKYDFD